MGYYLIGIGGTGARCLEAFVNLNGAGLLKDRQPVKIIFVDADVSNGNVQRTQETTNTYKGCQSIKFGESDLFKNSIEQIGDELWTPIPKDKKNLNDIFNYVALTNREDTKNVGLLYDALFTDQEKETPLDKGFRGHPAIGAAVMGKTVDITDAEPWKTLNQLLATDKEPRIFLFASVFGGTGAAGFPTIAKLVRDSLKKDNNGKPIAKIGGALVLPYFQFQDTDGSDQMRAKVEEFMNNTQYALAYYDRRNLVGSIFQSIYFMGDDDLTELEHFSIGSNDQRNPAHFVELYAALAALDFFNKTVFDGFETPMVGRDEETQGKDSISWEDFPGMFNNRSLKEKFGQFVRFLYLYRNVVLSELEKCAHEEGYEKNVSWYIDLVKKAGNIDVYTNEQAMKQFRALGELSEKVISWLEDIQSNQKRKVNLVNSEIFKNEKIDAYQIILPIIERTDKLTNDIVWKKLCDYKVKNTNASGSGVILQALYEICK